MEISYLAEINAFERWLESNYLPISSQLLWYKMMNLFNRSGWSEWVVVDNLRLMATMSMGREATLIKARDELIKAGRIVYQKGRKGSPNRYKMIYFTCKSAVKSEVYPVVESADIYRQRLDKDNKNKNSKESKEKRFVPPSMEEVASYCQERSNGIDAQEFVDFYASKNWMVGKNKMVDWRACVRTWERRRKEQGANPPHSSPAPNRFHNFDQSKTDYDALMMEKLQRRMEGGDGRN
ncbi:MAG TPA: hypothetical protein IAA51_02485 [Candidatus Cottocaccamicrobium excrementipullorum]|nr:hypothetical protein [Candidatus Cottocaccamicrobium excrementipullorum]